MSTWYYYNENGEKIEVTGKELKELAKNGKITSDTMIENEDGKTSPARRVKGLTFATPEQPAKTIWFYYDSEGQKQGPVTGGQLKGLAKAGQITPGTMVETENGKMALANKVVGLTFLAAGLAAVQAVASPFADSNPFSAPMPMDGNPFTASMPGADQGILSGLSSHITPENVVKWGQKAVKAMRSTSEDQSEGSVNESQENDYEHSEDMDAYSEDAGEFMEGGDELTEGGGSVLETIFSFFE
jgi:hypothetical protein